MKQELLFYLNEKNKNYLINHKREEIFKVEKNNQVNTLK